MLSARTVTWSKYHTVEPKILGAILKKKILSPLRVDARDLCLVYGDEGHVVELCYKLEGREFDSRWCHRNFFIDVILPAALWPWGWLSLWQIWVPGTFPGWEKVAGALGWQPYHLLVLTVSKSGSFMAWNKPTRWLPYLCLWEHRNLFVNKMSKNFPSPPWFYFTVKLLNPLRDFRITKLYKWDLRCGILRSVNWQSVTDV